jgi:UDP-2,4-diacetamido-2,4,6-trideoxy-beta-L-altropyranose hydrolase
MKIAIRVDASIQIGIGHVMRCLTLAKVLKENGAQVSFICREYPGHIQDYINKQDFIVKLLPTPETEYVTQKNDPDYAPWLGVSWEKDTEQTKEVLGDKIFDWLIVDHYGIDYRWHESLYSCTKNIMVIDDLADRKYNCDVLLDQTFMRKKEAYLSVLPTHSQLMVGTDYALLRPEFISLRLKAIGKRKHSDGIARILVCMGSMDPNNFTSLVLAGLGEVEWKEKPIIDVVLGSAAPKLKLIIDQAKKHILNVNVLQDVENMAELMVKADLAIGAGGTTSWERCCLGLPSLLVKLAENQRQVIDQLVKAVAARNVSNPEIDIINECNDLNKNNVAMSKMSKNAFKVVNGQGAQLVAIRMQPNLAHDGSSVTIRNANINDVDTVYKWQLNPNTRRYFHDSNVPQYDKHIEWFDKILDEPSKFFYIIEHKNKAAGVLRLDYQENTPNGYYLVSIYVAPEHYKQGIGTIALGYTDRLFGDSDLRAEVDQKNIASIKLFMKADYIKSNEHDLYIKNAKNRMV